MTGFLTGLLPEIGRQVLAQQGNLQKHKADGERQNRKDFEADQRSVDWVRQTACSKREKDEKAGPAAGQNHPAFGAERQHVAHQHLQVGATPHKAEC